MKNNKLSKKELDDVLIESLALATLLIEKYDTMLDNGFLVQNTKQSVKTALGKLDTLVNKVFAHSPEEAKDFSIGGSVIIEMQKNIEIAMKKRIILVDDKQEVIKNIFKKGGFSESQIDLYIRQFEENGIL